MNHSYFSEERDNFSKDTFEAPSRVYAPMYNWMWNGPVSREETDRQLAEMRRLGIKAVCIIPEPKSFRPARIPTNLEPDYLTPSYFAEYRYAVEKAKEMGMTLWLYDEGGWPSGGACGRVLTAHPALAKMRLASRTGEFSAGDTYEAAADTAAAFLENGEQIETGYVIKEKGTVTEYFAKRSCFEEPGIPDYPDLTRPEATDAFIEMGLDPYLPHIGECAGETISAVFSDEAKGPLPTPFRAEIEAAFEKRNGYSIRPFLPELLKEKPITPDGAAARISWFDLCSEMFCENYLLKEKAWSNKNGMAFTGHLNHDQRALGCMLNGGNYHLLRGLRCFDIPGIDVIWRQIFPYAKENPYKYITAENGIFPRYASSAAAQNGSGWALTESFGVYGAGLTYDEMRYIVNFQAVRGINVFNFFGIPYARKGFQMTGEMPFFLEKQACYADLAIFNQYMERLSYLAALGKNVSDTALYMPMHDFWAGERAEEYAAAFERAGDALENAQIPFDVLDDDVLMAAVPGALAKGEIAMGDARYTTLVIPPCRRMSEKSAETLRRFICGGGQVILLPGYAGPEIPGAVCAERAEELLAPPLKMTGCTDKIRLGHRRAKNGELYFIYNEGMGAVTLSVQTEEPCCILDLTSGRRILPKRTGTGIALTLSCGEMTCLWQGAGCEDAEEITAFTEETVPEEFSFRRTSRFRIGDMHYETEEISERSAPIRLGDWAETVGVEYSGSGVYETRFATPKTEGSVCIDLGEVHYTCEAFLNGKSLGVRVMAPYAYEIPAESLQEENRLEIRVTNTAANEYLHTKSFEKWSEWQLTVYWQRQKLFHEDSLSGGLYGPVRILY